MKVVDDTQVIKRWYKDIAESPPKQIQTKGARGIQERTLCNLLIAKLAGEEE